VKSLPLPALLLFAVLFSCKKDDSKNGSTEPPIVIVEPLEKNPVPPGIVDDVSGIADSRLNAGYLWLQQDNQTPKSEVTLITHKGVLLKRIFVKNAVNRDWEDMTISKGPDASKNYIYIADIGDNAKKHSVYDIYRFQEVTKETDTIADAEKIRFSYPGNISLDAEAFLVDPDTKDIFVIDANLNKGNVYRIAHPYSTTAVNTSSLVFTLPYGDVMSAAIQNDNKGIAIKSRDNIYFYPRSAGETITAVLAKTPQKLYYESEEMGQAMTFKLDDSGYFTIGERVQNAITLNFYRK